jgi:serine protease inhibitor
MQSKKSRAAFLSPWGIAHALSMLLEGANPGSASHRKLMEIVFATTGKDPNTLGDSLRESIKDLTTSITAANDDNTLTISDANSAWVENDIQLLDSYVQALETYFKAQARPLTSAKEVNSWVSEATHGKITEIIDQGAAEQASLVLVNAIYFKGLWETAFRKNDTMRLPFYKMDGSQFDSLFMYLFLKKGESVHAAHFQTATGTSCVAVRMAYQGGAYSAIVAMPEMEIEPPADGTPLTLQNGEDYAAALTACREALVLKLTPSSSSNASNADASSSSTSLQWQAIGDPEMKAVKIYLPRFEIEFGTSLSNALQKAGLGSIFQPGDFTAISSSGGSLQVSDVVHKVYVKVDEMGTEAAAATAVMMVKSMPMRPPPELFVKFDKPFVFTVVHDVSGLALFSGEVYIPEEWKEQ